jgi:transcriptional regulator with XRE-family HTH domain
MNESIPERETVIDSVENDFSEAKSHASDIRGGKTSLKGTENNTDDSVRRFLHSYDIGPKLRQLRLRKKIALVDLGKHTGLSASMLSQLENGKLVPTLPTLARIATVFDVGLEHFFSEKRVRRTFSIVRASERLRFPDLPDSPVPGFFFEVLAFGAANKTIGAYLAEFDQGETRVTKPHQHDGAEFIHVLQGVLAVNYQAEDNLLSAGDSVYFDASEPHSYCGRSEEPARAIVVTTSGDP